MINLSIKFDKSSIKGIKRELRRKNADLLQAMKDAVQDGTTIMEAELQATVPVITGNLSKSITVEFDKTGLIGKVGPDYNQAPYAWYVEFGRSRSGKVPPYPFEGRHYMERAFKNKKKEVVKILEEKIKQILR